MISCTGFRWLKFEANILGVFINKCPLFEQKIKTCVVCTCYKYCPWHLRLGGGQNETEKFLFTFLVKHVLRVSLSFRMCLFRFGAREKMPCFVPKQNGKAECVQITARPTVQNIYCYKVQAHKAWINAQDLLRDKTRLLRWSRVTCLLHQSTNQTWLH